MNKSNTDYKNVVVDHSEDALKQLETLASKVLISSDTWVYYEAKFDAKINGGYTKVYCLVEHLIASGTVTLSNCVNDLKSSPMAFERASAQVIELEGTRSQSWYIPDDTKVYCAEIEVAEGKALRTTVWKAKSVENGSCTSRTGDSMPATPQFLIKSSGESYTNRDVANGRMTYFYNKCQLVWWNWTKTYFDLPVEVCNEIKKSIDTSP